MKLQSKIIVTSQSFSKNETLKAELLEIFPNASFNPDTPKFDSDQVLIDFLQEADGAIVGKDRLNQAVLAGLPNLKIVAKYGVGLDNVDTSYAKSQGKTVGWTGGTNRRSVSEEALGFMLGLCRNLFYTNNFLKKGTWIKDGGFQLTGKTVGIVGAGFIGTDLLKLIQPFGCELLVCDILDKSETVQMYNAQQVELSELLRRSDVISLHVPLDDSTRDLINEQTLQQMKPSAFLINTCRGPVVDQEALKQALIDKTIAGAALDVYQDEPPTDLEFLALPNLVAAPHIGGNAKEAVEAMGRAAIHHLKTYFAS